MIFIRSLLFNILFYGLTGLACILCLPGLLLPRGGAFVIICSFVRSVHFLEKYVLGLDYEVRGLEHLPQNGSYIVAAKHQSAYETLKLHILFDFPAVILKQELLNIPLWGWFLKRSEPIAIDRSKGQQASQQIIEGAQKIEAQNRPIIIFPQGTRVHPWQTPAQKPYKSGVARIYKNTNMPIVPLALNSGLFWPRNSWTKRPGKVIFSFLPAIETGEDPDTIMKRLETTIETETLKLEQESRVAYKYLTAPAQTDIKT